VRAQELEAQQELLEQVEALVDVGRRPISDLYQQQAAVAEARAAIAEAERLVALTETQLIQVLQLDPTATYTFAAPTLADADDPDLPTYDLDQLLEEAFTRRADLDAIETEAAAARVGVRVAQAGYWPVLSLAVGYGSDWSSTALVPVPGTGTDPRTITVTPDDGPPATFAVPDSGTDPDFVRPTFFDQLDQRRGGSIRLSLVVPIFDRLQTRTQVAQAEVAALNARYALQDQQQQVALQVRQAVLDYRSARVQLAATTERVEAAERARDAASRRYELGAATFVELTQAITEAVAAQSAQVRARYDVLLAQTLIDYYTGQPDPQRTLIP
jgi:outer membrane protein